MDYASVQVMVVRSSAQEAVENSIRNPIDTKSLILPLSCSLPSIEVPLSGNYYSFIHLSTMKRDLVLGLIPCAFDCDGHRQ